MQMSMDFFQEAAEPSLELSYSPDSSARQTLENYIAVCGLISFKDFFMKIKNNQIEHIPDGLTRTQYLELAREVYQCRARSVERKQNRSKFFAVRNRIKKHRS